MRDGMKVTQNGNFLPEFFIGEDGDFGTGVAFLNTMFYSTFYLVLVETAANNRLQVYHFSCS